MPKFDDMAAPKRSFAIKRTEGCLTKPDGKAATSSWKTRIGIVWTLSRALDPAKRKYLRAGVPEGTYNPELLGAKRKFRIIFNGIQRGKRNLSLEVGLCGTAYFPR
jgi:hypothetical protein